MKSRSSAVPAEMSSVGDATRAIRSSSGGPGGSDDSTRIVENITQPGGRPGPVPRRRRQSSKEPAAAPSVTSAATFPRSAATSTRTSAPVERPSAPMRSGSISSRAAEEGEGALDVLGPAPAEVVRRALALAAPAGVVEQHAVAPAGEQLRVGDGAPAVAAAAVHDQHRGAVARRAVPAGEAQAVGRPEGDRLVARGGGADRLAPLVGLDDAQAHRTEDEDRAERSATTASPRPAGRARRDAATGWRPPARGARGRRRRRARR